MYQSSVLIKAVEVIPDGAEAECSAHKSQKDCDHGDVDLAVVVLKQTCRVCIDI